MNDPNKAISVNLSSLLSLKAELLRKQAEVNKAKTTRSATAEEYVANSRLAAAGSSSKLEKKQHAEEVSKDENATIYEHEDSALLEKSQRVLEAKSKFYERMTRTGGKLNSDDNCLVLFNRKRQEEPEPVNTDRHEYDTRRVSSSDSEQSASDSEDEDWVEYVDCLGRTRKCLRADLESAKKRDAELAASMPERLDQTKANWMIDTKGDHTKSDEDDDDLPIGPLPPGSVNGDGLSMMSKHDEQRANWERKEQENLDKADVHYQDVFFDEARQHGVGYYAFSTDEEERKRQQTELETARQQTISEQERHDALRLQREKIIAERVRAAKNRQRARQGLPPLEETPEEQPQQENAETKEERRARKRAEKLKKKQELEEKEREIERQQHVRPWDEEKTGVTSKSVPTEAATKGEEPEWTYKAERVPLSQAEWNERKRAERIAEFAPIPTQPEPSTAPQLKRTNFTIDTSMPPPPVPMHFQTMAPPPGDDSFSNFQSTKNLQHFRKRNYAAANEEPGVAASSSNPHRGPAIPPPANLNDYYRTPAYMKKSKSGADLERSIEAGLRFLRESSDKESKTTKSSWTAKADY